MYNTSLSMDDPEAPIVVAMSGGVDSSTVAAMLHAKGHKVIGITLQLYDYGLAAGKKGACCAGQDIYDARIVADKLGIPHYVLDYESRFRSSVIDDFADSYLRGETPLPCVRCNQSVKFHDLLKMAKQLGANRLVTGHYVQKKLGENGPELHAGKDPNKDQSYFLFATTKEQLEYLDFPLGGMTKDQTRKLALQYGLQIADKPDSQDICFVPNGDYRQVIRKIRPEAEKEGKILHVDGYELGKHNGIINYTIGQRRGIGLSYQEPLYVTKIDPENNIVYVGPSSALESIQFYIKELNWLGEKIDNSEELEVTVKIRSSHTPVSAKVRKIQSKNEAINNNILNQNEEAEFRHYRPETAQTSGNQGILNQVPDNKNLIRMSNRYIPSDNNNLDAQMLVTLNAPAKAVTPGQACVIYDGTRVLGGGWIKNTP